MRFIFPSTKRPSARLFILLIFFSLLLIVPTGIFSAFFGLSETAFLETGEQITVNRDPGIAAERIELDESFLELWNYSRSNFLVYFAPEDFDFLKERVVPYFLERDLSEIRDERELYCTVYNAVREFSLLTLVDFKDHSIEIPFTVDNGSGAKIDRMGRRIPLHCMLNFHGIEFGHSYLAVYKIPDFSGLQELRMPSEGEVKYLGVQWIVSSEGILSFGETKWLGEWE